MININFLRTIKEHKKRVVIVSGALFLIVAVSITLASASNNDDTDGQVLGETLQPVSTVIVGQTNDGANDINTSGIVHAASKVDVVALGNGTVTGIYFDIGDKVSIGQPLAQLHDEVALSNFNSASTNFTNTQASFNLTTQLVEESVRQAELGLKSAEQALISAQVGAKAAKDNYDNALNMQGNSRGSTLTSGLVSYHSYLSSVANVLNQVDYIIKVDGSAQLPGIAPTLAALSSQSLYNAEASYASAKQSYDAIKDVSVDEYNLSTYYNSLVDVMAKTQTALNDTILVLDNTIPNENFSETSLTTQKGIYTGLRQSFMAEQGAANATLLGLENLDLINKTELDRLQAALDVSNSALKSAQIGFENATTALESAKKSKQQQLLSSQIALSAAESQFNIASNALSNLNLTAPISGTVTFKSLELGAELNPGQRIAEISESNLVKIIVNLSSDDIYRIKVGQPVLINSTYEGIINTIDPAADPVTRKVKVEILHVNDDNELIPETFADVTISIAQSSLSGDELISDPAAILIPLKAVTITQTEKFVFTFDNGYAKKVGVTTGAVEGDSITILSGLSLDDELIVTGNKGLTDGQEVSKE